MAWSYPVATVVIDATDQRGLRIAACDRLIVAVVVKLGLHRVKEITIEDGALLVAGRAALFLPPGGFRDGAAERGEPGASGRQR